MKRPKLALNACGPFSVKILSCQFAIVLARKGRGAISITTVTRGFRLDLSLVTYKGGGNILYADLSGQRRARNFDVSELKGNASQKTAQLVNIKFHSPPSQTLQTV